jgi:transglutaminase-like putative cysteine protease
VRVSITHSTVYRYSAAVYLEPQTIRLRPRADASQRVLQHALSILPFPAGRTECLDQDGNVITEAWFDGPTDTVSIQSAFAVETLRENPFDFLLRPGTGTLPLVYSPAVHSALEPYFRQPPAGVREFSASLSGAAGHALDFLSLLNRTLCEEFKYAVREIGAPHTAETTLQTREGSCRDLAVLFCEAARAAGIAARFVSGYQCGPVRDEGEVQMHAWAEVYLEGGGWRGYDPSSGLAVGTGHVALAAAADPALAAPVSGTFRGNAEASMGFAVALQSIL